MSTPSDPKDPKEAKDSTPTWNPKATLPRDNSILGEPKPVAKDTTPTKLDPIELLKEKRAQRLKQEESDQDSQKTESIKPQDIKDSKEEKDAQNVENKTDAKDKGASSRHFTTPLPTETEDEEKEEATQDSLAVDEKDIEDMVHSLEEKHHEHDAPTQTQAPVTIIEKSSNPWTTIILLLICVGLLGTTGYLFVQHKQTLPPDPSKEAQQQYMDVYKKHGDMKLRLLELEQNKLNLNLMERERESFFKAKERLAQQDKQIDTLKKDIAQVKEDMVQTFIQYKGLIQKQSRNLEINQLVTRSGKQYIDVKLTRCQPNSISFTHSEGATTINTAELPDALLDRLAYTNPFQDIVDELRANRPTQPVTAKAIPVKKPAPAALPIAPESYDPPSGAPKVNSQPEKGSVDDIDFDANNIELPDELLLPAKE